MIPRIQTGTSFKGAGLYYLHDKKREGERERLTTERVAWTYARNTLEEEPEAVLAEMRQTAFDQALLKHLAGRRADGRPTERTVLTVALAWSPEQSPSREDMIAAGVSYLTHMEWQDHQVLFVAHNDTKHPHVHLIVNRIHPETGMTIDDTWSRRRSQEWALAYEREHGQIYCHAREAKYGRDRTGGRESMNYREWREWQEISKDRLFDPAFRRSVEAGEWSVLKQAQRQERTAFWRETSQQRQEMRTDLRQQVREEFADEWAVYAQQRDQRFEKLSEQDRGARDAIGRRLRQGVSRADPAIERIKERQKERHERLRAELAVMRKDIAERQSGRLEELAAPALESLSKERLVAYKAVLARHRSERAELRDDQEQGNRRPDILNKARGEVSTDAQRHPQRLSSPERQARPLTRREKMEEFYRQRERSHGGADEQNPEIPRGETRGARVRAPKRGGSDLVAGAGLSLIGKIADSLETLFDGSPKPDHEDHRMGKEQENVPQQKNPQPTQVDQELEARRKADLEFYLQQRDRERHRDRGR